MSHTDRGKYSCDETKTGEEPGCFPHSLQARTNMSHLQENLSDWPDSSGQHAARGTATRGRLASEFPVIDKQRVEVQKRPKTANCVLPAT